MKTGRDGGGEEKGRNLVKYSTMGALWGLDSGNSRVYISFFTFTWHH